ncbi:uncharacterized protein JCM10292_001762 [Rhodotorula paludigena]|uniref:uncharacterized protein n=1 Tax=Rhodotorula paludigena TaxID=86838 RepID=UPI00317559A3
MPSKSGLRDNGSEYTSTTFLNLAAKHGISLKSTRPYLPPTNSVAKQVNRTIVEGVLDFLEHASASQHLWAKALAAFTHGRAELDARTVPLIFVGYNGDTAAYRLFEPGSGCTIRLRNVRTCAASARAYAVNARARSAALRSRAVTFGSACVRNVKAGSRTAPTPMVPNQQICPAAGNYYLPPDLRRRYLQAVGSLTYAMLGNRPNSAHVVGVLSRYSAHPDQDH